MCTNTYDMFYKELVEVLKMSTKEYLSIPMIAFAVNTAKERTWESIVKKGFENQYEDDLWSFGLDITLDNIDHMIAYYHYPLKLINTHPDILTDYYLRDAANYYDGFLVEYKDSSRTDLIELLELLLLGDFDY